MKINIENSGEILENYKPLLVSTLNQFSSITKDRDESLDEMRELVIDTILKYDCKKSNFSGFLKYSLYYHFLDKAKKQVPLSLNDLDNSNNEIQESLADDFDLEEEFIKKEDIKDLYRAISLLDKKDREIINLKYLKNLSTKEIGQKLGLSTKTIRNRHYELIKKLRILLKVKKEK